MTNKIKNGNIVSPHGASIIFYDKVDELFDEAGNFIGLAPTEGEETYAPYQLIITPEEDEDGATLSAKAIKYTPVREGVLTSVNVQDALVEADNKFVELESQLGSINLTADAISYNASGNTLLTAATVQAALGQADTQIATTNANITAVSNAVEELRQAPAPTLETVTAQGASTAQAVSITNTTASTDTTTGALIVAGGAGIAGDVYASKVYGAVWNDYAEYRSAAEAFVAGDCMAEGPDGKLYKTHKRKQKNPKIVSDTFGFAIGETENEKCPIAVCGRVLAHGDKPNKKFKVGDVVCAGKNGSVSKMHWWEKIFCPDRILGIISEIPSYEIWNGIHVSGRFWVNVK